MAADGRPSLDDVVADVVGGASTWAATLLPERISLLERLMPRVLARAEAMVADAAAAKGYDIEAPSSAEDWANCP